MATAETERNKATLRRFCEAMNTGDPERITQTIDQLVAPDAQIRTPLPLALSGVQAMQYVFATLHQAYPDLQITIEDLIAEGDTVVSRNSVRGTHRGDYLGIPPTGRSVTYNEIFVFRFADGQITESWGVVDVLSQMRQLGAVLEAPKAAI
jgi:steroid delta-isomerase-like uncharacterized protein